MIALSLVTAGSVGYVCCGLFAGMENGLVEFLIVMVSFLGSAYHYTGVFCHHLLCFRVLG